MTTKEQAELLNGLLNTGGLELRYVADGNFIRICPVDQIASEHPRELPWTKCPDDILEMNVNDVCMGASQTPTELFFIGETPTGRLVNHIYKIPGFRSVSELKMKIDLGARIIHEVNTVDIPCYDYDTKWKRRC